jgi:hypothetical protein
MNSEIKHEDYINFLKNIDLDGYRQKYRPYMSVEENLPRDIQILDSIYETYWVNRNLINFDEFIQKVIGLKINNLKHYNRKRNGFDELSDSVFPLFLKGWVARQYRTWASIITQIQLGYLYEELFPEDKVLMSDLLDSQGIDIRVEGKKDYGVKKVSKRQDIHINKNEKDGVVPIKYWVPKIDDLKNPKKINGQYRKGYLTFKEDGRLDFLENGFIIFNKKVFSNVKE